MSSPVQAHTEQRRKLIKAAAGASAVFTLPSGAALANVSATCDQKSLKIYKEATSKPTGFSGASDGWMRVKLQKYKVKSNLPGQSGLSEGDGFTYGGKWFRVLSSSTGVNKAVEVVPNKTTKKNGEFLYGLVHYDNNAKMGKLVLDQGAETVNPVAGASCWNSLTGATLNSNTIIP